MLPSPDRAAGLLRLAEFAPHMGADYAQNRNFDGGPGLRRVSGLSAHLRHRLITESEAVGTALALHGAKAAEKFIQEVFWRSYWKGFLELRPAMWTEYRLRALAEHERLNGSAALHAAMAGETGIACFDAWARELIETGWLHNHARMWFASIWIFTLRLPWVLGAEFFLAHLADADAASNTLSWRWVAGIQTPGKHYLARAENIARFTQGRFHPKGELDEDALAIAEPGPPPALPLPRSDTMPAGRVALLLHEDDVGFWPEGAEEAEGAEVVAVASLVPSAARGLFGQGGRAAAFSGGALADGVGAAALRAQLTPAQVTSGGLAIWARGQGVRQIVTPWLPVGCAAEAISEANAACVAEGVTILRLRRPWDGACWPLASKGFFPFRENIPRIIAQLRPAPPAEQ